MEAAKDSKGLAVGVRGLLRDWNRHTSATLAGNDKYKKSKENIVIDGIRRLIHTVRITPEEPSKC